MRVYEGTIVSCAEGGEAARYLVEDKGRIAFVGGALPEEYGSAPRFALGERALPFLR